MSKGSLLRKPQPQQNAKSNQKSSGKDDPPELMVSGSSAFLKVQMHAEKLFQRDVLFEMSQGGITTEQFSEAQLVHKYNRSGSVVSHQKTAANAQQTSK